MFNSITTDGSNIIYAHEIFKIESTGNSSIATKAQLDDALITAGGLTQQDLDDAVAPLIVKDTAFGNTINTHIGLIADLNITVSSNLTEIDNLKATSTTHLLNIDANKVNINAINTNLTDNYQTNSQLATTLGDYVLNGVLSSDYLSTTQINASYYDKAYIGTNFYTIGQIQSNYYDRTYIDANIGGGGYTDAQIDTLLDAKLDVSETSGNITFFPVIDCLRPLYICKSRNEFSS